MDEFIEIVGTDTRYGKYPDWLLKAHLCTMRYELIIHSKYKPEPEPEVITAIRLSIEQLNNEIDSRRSNRWT